MDHRLRKSYNENFTIEKYEAFKKYVGDAFGHVPKFRLCETPVFMDADMRKKLLDACEEINEVLIRPDFKSRTDAAILNSPLNVPNEDDRSRFIQMDFGICINSSGELLPQLIEIQGFPSLYFFQDLLYHGYREIFDIPKDHTSHFQGLDSASYIEVMRRIIVGDADPKNVVLLEIEPEKQATSIDFYAAKAQLGIKILCLSKMKKRDRKLYYLDGQGREIPIHRIFNRVIFDELVQRKDLEREFYFADEVDVEWVGHPNWFFRISKFTMPLLSGKYVPESFYLDQIEEYPVDLENYVLKPLYSFAGMGVNLQITSDALDKITDRENYILQRKVQYAPVIETPTGPAKFEIRMLMVWEKDEPRPKVINNLIRVSKGEMVGVRYNKDKDWVGASVGFFAPEK